MSEPKCIQVRDAATEYALGILPAGEAAAVSEHLLSCPACRCEVDEIRSVGERLLDLIPSTEPPVGFERKALAGMTSRQRHGRRKAVPAVAAAVVAIVALAATTLIGPRSTDRAVYLSAALRQGGHTIGSVHVSDNPAWIAVTVKNADLGGTVICQMVRKDGTATAVGDFRLDKSGGTWSAPDVAGPEGLAGARLVAPNGVVLATATFSSN